VAGIIEIDIDGARVRLHGTVDRANVRCVLQALRGAGVIGMPANTRVCLAAGHTDMRRGFDGLARQRGLHHRGALDENASGATLMAHRTRWRAQWCSCPAPATRP
jgi:hypothetical protein